MSGRTGVEVVLVKGADGSSIWDIDSAGHGQVDVVSMPALSPLVDGVYLGGASVGTPVKVTSLNSLCVKVDRVGAGGGGGGTVAVAFSGNTWHISSTNAGPVFVQGRAGTDVEVTSGNSFVVASAQRGDWGVTATQQGAWTVTQKTDPWNIRINQRTHVEQALSGLNTTFDGSPASTVSASFACTYYTDFLLCGYVTVNSNPTDIKFEVRFKSGTTWVKYLADYWGDVRWTDTAVGANGLYFALPGKCIGNKIRAFATAVGAGSTARFTVQDAALHLKA